MMDETQAQKVLADATAPPMPGPGQLVDPPEVAWYAQRGDPPISEWPGRAVTRKDRSLPKKQRHTAKRIYERLRAEHGFYGKYTIVKDYVRERRRRTQEMYVPLSHPAGDAQCDFGQAKAVIDGVEQTVHYFVLDLPTATHASSRPTPQRRPRRSATVTSRPSRSWVACPGASSTTTRDWPWPGSWETTGGSVPASSRSWYPTTCSRSGSAGETLDPMRPVERFSGSARSPVPLEWRPPASDAPGARQGQPGHQGHPPASRPRSRNQDQGSARSKRSTCSTRARTPPPPPLPTLGVPHFGLDRNGGNLNPLSYNIGLRTLVYTHTHFSPSQQPHAPKAGGLLLDYDLGHLVGTILQVVTPPPAASSGHPGLLMLLLQHVAYLGVSGIEGSRQRPALSHGSALAAPAIAANPGAQPLR